MIPRLEAELEILRAAFPDVQVAGPEPWILVRGYAFPAGLPWNRTSCDVVMLAPAGYPTTPPKNIWVPAGILFDGQKPDHYEEPSAGPPFPGTWGAFSWGNPEVWNPGPDPRTGANLLNFVLSFTARLQEGK